MNTWKYRKVWILGCTGKNYSPNILIIYQTNSLSIGRNFMGAESMSYFLCEDLKIENKKLGLVLLRKLQDNWKKLSNFQYIPGLSRPNCQIPGFPWFHTHAHIDTGPFLLHAPLLSPSKFILSPFYWTQKGKITVHQTTQKRNQKLKNKWPSCAIKKFSFW